MANDRHPEPGEQGITMAGACRMSKAAGIGLVAASIGFLVHFGGHAIGLPNDDRAQTPIEAAVPSQMTPPNFTDPLTDFSVASQERVAALDPVTFEPGADEASGNEPFGSGRQRLPEGPLWSKWRVLARDIARDMQTISQCREDATGCTPGARQILAIIDSGTARTGRARLGIINRAVNLAIKATSDEAQHGVIDRWSAPLATFNSGRGDCEDYAVAKYVILRQLGVPAEDLRLLIVRDKGLRQDHAVLAARLDGRWLVLDNRRFTLVEDRYAQYAPLFALDMDGVSRIAETDAERPVRLPDQADRAG